ncbi:protein kinase domain-containing protein [Planctomycetaceae bacterium SH139]
MMTAIECPTSKDLKALTLGQLSSDDSDDLFRHISTCDACRVELDTVEDSGDSLIASLRSPDQDSEFSREPDCQLAVTKALGALASVGQTDVTAEIPQLPSAIGEYEIVRPIGRGGMGSVYLARHTKLGREVALKVLASHRLADARMRDRFESEMRAVGRLSHPNIVTAHDAREVNGTAVLVTELVSGMDLGQLLQRTGTLSLSNACEIVRQIAVALSYTHQQGFVHRDIKPSNVMLSASGEVKLLDLGLARLQYGEHQGVEVADAEITGTGQAMGSADYVAPEQVTDSKTVDIRADIYALGCTLFKLLTGRAPFADEQHTTAFAKMTAHVSKTPPSLKERLPDAPRGLVHLIDSMLAKEPCDRPQTPWQVVDALLPFCEGHDLVELSLQAASLEPRFSLDAPGTSSAKPVKQSWMRRKVPTFVAVAAGLFGVLFGMFLSIIIVITNPDGTKSVLELAEGSRVEIKEGSSSAAVPPQAKPVDQLGSDSVPGQATDRNLATSTPLAFGILVNPASIGRSPAISDVGLAEATSQLHASNGETPVKTDHGTWMELSDDLSAPIKVKNAGKSFALVSNEMAIIWPEIQGHVVSTQAAEKGKGEIDLIAEFDAELGAKFRQLTGRNIRNQLAIIVNAQIRVAPYINTEMGEKVAFSGTFEHAEVRQLQQWLHGGLVNQLPSIVPASEGDQAASLPLQGESISRVEQLFDGVWRVLDVIDGGSVHSVSPLQSPAAVFHNGQMAIFRDNKLEDVGRFLIRPLTSNPAKGDHPQIIIQSTISATEVVGIYAFYSQNQLTLCINEHGDEVPTQFASMENSPNDLLMKLERVALPIEKSERSMWLEEPANATILKALETYSAWKLGKAVPEQDGVSKLGRAKENLRQIGIAFHNFHDVYQKFPGTVNSREGGLSLGAGKKTYPFSWRVAILPFIEQNELFEAYRFDEPWDSEANLKLLDKMPEIYRSPFASDDQKLGESNIVGFAGEHTALGTAGGHGMHEFTDGTANTLLLFEARDTVPWTKPEDLSGDDGKVSFFADHPLLYLLADGSVESLEKFQLDRLRIMITRDGGELSTSP